MLRNLALITLTVSILAGFSACDKIPDHASLIPADVTAVTGINTRVLGKQIAWSALAGSRLFRDLERALPGNAMVNDLGDAGIRKMSVAYIYAKSLKDPEGGNQLTALIPLDNQAKWESYLKKAFPAAAIKEAGKRKEASLGKGIYAGWNKGLLIVVYNTPGTYVIEHDAMNPDSSGVPAQPAVETALATHPADDGALVAELAQAFLVKKDASLIQDRRFKKLQEEDHGVSFWVNYETVMEENKSKMQGAGGLSLPGTLWKKAALAAGLDFEKGRIAGEMLYYAPDELKEVSKQLGSISADKEMITRLPAGNLNALMALHLEPAGVKGMLDKIGILGFVNLALSGNNLSVDDILDAFTGDMVLSLNDASIVQGRHGPAVADSSQVSVHSDDVSFGYVFAMKINNKEKFGNLFRFLVQDSMLTGMTGNTFMVRSLVKDSTFLTKDDNYLVVSNRHPYAQAFVQGTYKGQDLPASAKDIYNHPYGLYVDFQSILNAVKPVQPFRYSDSVTLAESRKLFENFVFRGGDFKNDAFSYHMDLNFVNKEENGLIQLLSFGMKMNDARERQKQLALTAGQQANNSPVSRVAAP